MKKAQNIICAFFALSRLRWFAGSHWRRSLVFGPWSVVSLEGTRPGGFAEAL